MAMRYVEIQARSVDDAVRLACEQLDVTPEQVEVEVLSGDETGSEDDEVLVRVSVRAGSRTAERLAAQAQAADRPRPESRGRFDARGPRRDDRVPRRDDRVPREESIARPPRPPRIEPEEGDIVVDVFSSPDSEDGEQSFGSPADAVAPIAAEVLQRLLIGMRFRGRIERHDVSHEAALTFNDEDPAVVLNITGIGEQDKSLLIGRRGEALAALQFMVNLLLGAKTDLWARVVIDVDGYRLKRNEALTNLAQRMAERVLQQRQAFQLEPMSPYDRRIVHMALSDHPEVRTESTGEGDERRVVIMLRPN